MEATEARRLINTAGREHTLVVYFTKADGTKRRMVARYNGALSNHPDVLRVWDIEKGAWRSVNVTRIQGIKVLGVSRPATERATDRAPQEPQRPASTAEMKEQLRGVLFY